MKKIMTWTLLIAVFITTTAAFMLKSESKDSMPRITDMDTFVEYYSISDNTKGELLALQEQGYEEGAIRIAYSFLNDNYGKKSELINLLDQKKGGSTWQSIFTNYNSKTESFIPRAFERDYLDQLMMNSTVSSDDIIICDRLSFVTGKEFKEVMERYLEQEEKNWQAISEELGIINSQRTLIRVPVTTEQIKKAQATYGLSENKIVTGYVLASKFNVKVEDIMIKIMSGQSKEKILAFYLEEMMK